MRRPTLPAVTRGRRWLLWTLLLGVGAGGLLCWWLARGEAAPALVLEASRTGSATSPSGGASRAEAPGLDRAAMPASAGSSASGTSIEVCGAGRVDRREFERWRAGTDGTPPPWVQAQEPRRDAALSALAARLSVGSDGDQVAARLLMGDVDGAALIASRSADPTAYRLALTRCMGYGPVDAPNCQGLSVQGWAKLDPGDGRPWLVMAARAVERGDDEAAAQALEQAMQRRWRSPSSPLIAIAARAGTGVSDEAGLGLAMVHVIGVDAAQPIPEIRASHYCSKGALVDVSRQDRCTRLANWQFEHADSWLDAMMATSLADRVGLPAAQRPYTREQLERGQQRMLAEFDQMMSFDCTNLQRVGRRVVQRAETGELREILKAAGT